jgi:hypothetical protein
MPAGNAQYTVGPIVAVVVICVLALVLRWVFGSGRSRAPTRPTGAVGEYGLLRRVAVLPGAAEGEALRAVLTDAGIRSTMTARPDGQVDILVFPDDADRARALIPPA